MPSRWPRRRPRCMAACRRPSPATRRSPRRWPQCSQAKAFASPSTFTVRTSIIDRLGGKGGHCWQQQWQEQRQEQPRDASCRWYQLRRCRLWLPPASPPPPPACLPFTFAAQAPPRAVIRSKGIAPVTLDAIDDRRRCSTPTMLGQASSLRRPPLLTTTELPGLTIAGASWERSWLRSTQRRQRHAKAV